MKLPKFLRRNLFKTKKKNTQSNNNQEVRGITLKEYRKKDTIIANLQNEKATLVETNTTLVIKIKNLEQKINDLETKLSTMGYRTNEALYNKLPTKIEPIYASMKLTKNQNESLTNHQHRNAPLNPANEPLYENPAQFKNTKLQNNTQHRPQLQPNPEQFRRPSTKPTNTTSQKRVTNLRNLFQQRIKNTKKNNLRSQISPRRTVPPGAPPVLPRPAKQL